MATTVPPVLRVGVEEARALLSGDLNGLSDPYVQLELLDQRGDVVVGAPAPRTATKIKTLSPVWTESFVLGDGDVDLRTVTTLRFTVVDFDSWKTDDVLGEVLVPVDTALQLANDPSSEQWFQVKKVEGKMAKDATGELRITFTREAPGASAKKAAAASKESTETAEAAEEGDEPNLLYVTIESGRDLLPMDDKDRTSDPTVKLSLTGQLFQTASVAKTLKPHWDERFAFVVRDPHTTLELRVEDEDAVKNDLLGRAQLILADIVGANVGVETKRDVVLLNEKLENDKDRGVLHIRLQWVHDPNSETVARSMRKKKAQAVSVFQALTAKLHLTAPDAVTAEDDDDADEIARVNEAEGVLQDESDHEVEDDDKALRFAAVTVHRAEQLPPLDALHFDKVKDRKPTAPGGGIDAYACAWLSEKPQETVRTRIHTRKGRREELTTNFNETLLLALPVAKPVVKKETETETVAVAVVVTESEKESETTTTEVKVLSAKTSEVDVTTVTKTEVEITAAGETVVKTEELKTTETETATVAEVTKTVVTKTETETDKDTEILVEEVDVVEPEPQPVVKAPVNVTLAVMDWDSIGGDEVVSHVELRDVEALVLAKQGKPFWVNLYGAPLIGVKNKAAVDAMNTTSDVGSTFRGRVLLSLKIVTKSAAAYDERHQKRRAAKLPRELYPSSSVYRLRAHFLSAIGLPDPAGKYYVAVSCGMYEISSAQKAAHNRAVEWNETEESDRLVFPDDVNQIPDVVLSLCTGEWEKRVVVSYTRFKAADLLKHGFDDTTVEWVPLKADPTTDAVARNQFPGKVLLRLGFGSLAQANEQIWDQKAMTEVVNRRVPYQIRVRVYGAQDVSGVDRKAPVYLRVQCGDKEITARHVVVDQHSPATVLSLDVNLPQLAFASQVLVHVSEDVPEDEKESSAPYIGTLAVSLQAAKDVSGVDASAIVTHCSSEQLKSNTRPQTPQAKWLPLLSLEDTIESMRVLASVEVIRKMYPDQKLPEPEAIAAAS